MRLPRRVPWASLSELDEVCSWIYTDESDIDAKVLAVNRLSAWKSITSLPHALEATLSILTAILQDASSQNSTTFLSLRQSYATAIIRLVNGLVDSLQVGAYARSIASIASQLGLPAWFVELRHSATHEDLPSLEVLRTATRDAMRWLLDNYFLPTLNPSAQSSATSPPLRPLSPLLQKYKTLLKSVTRDASLKNQHKDEITRTLREIERWMAEAKVAAKASLSAFEWDVGNGEQDTGQEDTREKWALDRFCDHLLEKGVLVPLSKKKRMPSSNDGFEPSETTLRIWTPLIAHVHSIHRSFSSALVSKILSHLSSRSSTTVDGSEADTILLLQDGRDTSYDVCLATWANWLMNTYESDGYGSEGNNDQSALSRENVVISLLGALRPDKSGDGGSEKIVRKLLKVLCSNHPQLEHITSLVPSLSKTSSSEWHDEDLLAMTQRLDATVALQTSSDTSGETQRMDIDSEIASVGGVQANAEELPTGWKKMTAQDGWRSTPVGVFVGSTGSLGN
ncbi:Las1-domain-containing protein [Cristinia sonorae]|uniref:Las1-domain-containing protein n=1 Tax=Cristinia sonorae TaxID=1940300 RepID=A0A8K0UH05_9AGAR|nr:Las1-domain-containing protein [Cristinia sonorae]